MKSPLNAEKVQFLTPREHPKVVMLQLPNVFVLAPTLLNTHGQKPKKSLRLDNLPKRLTAKTKLGQLISLFPQVAELDPLDSTSSSKQHAKKNTQLR
ncbi:hypothetical protein ACFX19_019897 [Malus domestica]